jgi:hypothetical protein
MTLKQINNILVSAILICMVSVTNVCGQALVTGHVTAEVIESVHTSSKIVTGFALNNEQCFADSLQQDENDPYYEILNLGAVTINAGASMIYDIKLKEATLSDRIA